MKKTFVTLATVAALVAAAAPAATTLANNGDAFNTNTKVDAKAAQLGRDFQIQLAKVELAQKAASEAAEKLANKTNDLIASQEAVKAGETQVGTANKTAEILLQQAKQKTYATPEEATQALVDAEAAGKAGIATAEETLRAAKDNLTHTEGVIAELTKDAEAKHAVLLAEQAKLAELEKAFLNAGGQKEDLPSNPAAPGQTAAPAKTVAAAKTPAGSKTLPKTSAAK